MADWLERAKRKFAQSAGQGTAKADERNPTAVMAVPDPGDTEILRATIGSNGSTTVTDPQEFQAVGEDDRRACRRCENLTERGLCLAAWRGEIVASRSYEPISNLLRRCEGYAPSPADPDRRHGRERWPALTDTKGMK